MRVCGKMIYLCERFAVSVPETRREASDPEGPRVFALIRDRILSGMLPAGTRMGTVHQLARELDVSRTLAAGAFDQLLAEGYIEARPPNTYVVAAGAAFKTEESPELVLPACGRTVPFRFDLIDFGPGVPDFSRFPTKVRQRLASEMWRRILPLDLSYGKPEGRAELRREIARHLCTRRGVRCHPEQILVTNGSTQAMGLVSALLLEMSGPACILEDPGALETQRIVTGLGARVHPVPADEHGLLTAALPQRIRPAFIHVTPSHHFPLGGTVPVFRCVQLLKYAQRHSAFIIEEDYDGDFRYDSPPVSSLQGLCPSRVIFIGTFSMSLFPSLRIGYVVVPPVLIDGMRDAKILLHIIVPITKPALAVVAIFTFLASWNDYLGPLLYLNERKLYTLALGLQSMLSQYTSDWHVLMAAATLVTAPLIILFFLAQKFFVEGLTMGGIKA
jgi:GntR family transcriptional regulator / MocR family aminotransferase